MQRYKYVGSRTAQYLGGIGGYDVFWVDESRKLILKHHDAAGASFIYDTNAGKWMRGHTTKRRLEDLTEDMRATAFAMRDCFAIRSDPTPVPDAS